MSLVTVPARIVPAPAAAMPLEDVHAPTPVPAAHTCALPVSFEFITTRAAFDALEDAWTELFARAGTSAQVFQTFNWNWHWANHYLGSSPGGIPGLKLCTLTGWRDGKLIMVWPLVSERVRGITQIFWMGEPVSQYGDVLIDDMPDAIAVMRASWAYLRAHANADIMRLRRVREDARVAPLMLEIGARGSNPQIAPCLDLASAKTFEACEQRFTAKSRRNRRRYMRRLEDQGDVRFERLHGGAMARACAQAAIDLKGAWLASRGLVSHALSDARMRGFFADAAEAASHPAGCVISRLMSNGETAALDVSFACKERLAVHVIVFNLAFEKAGVGALLMERCIRDAFDENIAVYDLMAPGDDYKLDWTDGSVGVNDWTLPFSLKGQAYAQIYLDTLRGRLKSAITAIPKPLRQRLTSVLRAKACETSPHRPPREGGNPAKSRMRTNVAAWPDPGLRRDDVL